MKANYVRVSTTEQNPERQTEGIEGLIFMDKVSGSTALKDRTEGKRLIEAIERKEVTELHIHSIDRLGRNTIELLQNIEYFTSLGCNVVSKKEGLQTLIEGKINPVAKLMIGILSTLAEFELDRIKERQKEGIAIAKKKGSYAGRPNETKESTEVFMNKAKSKQIANKLLKGFGIRQTALLTKSSATTVQKVYKVLQAKKIKAS
jgi:DNA invertase Pin-like site-specific DNA recombinase